MGYMGNLWNSVKYSIGSTTSDILSTTLRYRYIVKADGDLVYKNNRDPRLTVVRVGTQIGYQMAEAELKKILPRYLKHVSSKRLKKVAKNPLETTPHMRKANEDMAREKMLKEQDANFEKLIKEREIVNEGLGSIDTAEGHRINAVDAYGRKIHNALFLYYDGDVAISVERPGIGSSDKKETISTKTVFFYDVNPRVTQNTNKEVILTKVQGRDYTRKELVAGGDIHFSVSGEINSNLDGVYPENDVKKLIQILQYGGIVKVRHRLFDQFNVKQVIIQEFRLLEQTFENIQPYSFTCVAVEPNEDVIVSKDTVTVIDQAIYTESSKELEQLIVDEKLAEIKGEGNFHKWGRNLLTKVVSNLI